MISNIDQTININTEIKNSLSQNLKTRVISGNDTESLIEQGNSNQK